MNEKKEVSETEQQKAKHTPLPWRAIESKDARGNPCGYAVWQDLYRPYIDSPRGQRVCGTADGTTAENKANSEFVVLACNNHYTLLETIKMLTESLEVVMRVEGWECEQGVREEIALAKTVIAKVEGRA